MKVPIGILLWTLPTLYGAVPSQSVANSKLLPDRADAWADEVFGLTYNILVTRRVNPQLSSILDWNPSLLVIEGWSKPESIEDIVDGERGVKVSFRTRALAKTSGTFELAPVRHTLVIRREAGMERLEVVSEQSTLSGAAIAATTGWLQWRCRSDQD